MFPAFNPDPLFKPFAPIEPSSAFNQGVPLNIRLERDFIQLNGLLSLAAGVNGGRYTIRRFRGKIEIVHTESRGRRLSQSNCYSAMEFDPAKALDDLTALLFLTGRGGKRRSAAEHASLRRVQSRIQPFVNRSLNGPELLSAYIPHLGMDLQLMRQQAGFLKEYELPMIAELGRLVCEALDKVEGHHSTSGSSSSDGSIDSDCLLYDEDLLAGDEPVMNAYLVASLAALLTDSDYSGADDMRIADSVLSEVCASSLEYIEGHIRERVSSIGNMRMVWVEVLLSEFSSPGALNLAAELLAKDKQVFESDPQLQQQLVNCIGALIARLPLAAPAFLRAINSTNCLPRESLERLNFHMMHQLALSPASGASILLSNYMPDLIKKVRNEESIIHEALFQPEEFVRAIVVSLIESGEIEQGLQLLNASAHSKLVKLTAPAFFNIALRLLADRSGRDSVTIAQWDLFEKLSRKPLDEDQRKELKAAMQESSAWMTSHDDAQVVLQHLDKASPFIERRHEFALRREIASDGLRKGVINGRLMCVLSNLYRMKQLAEDEEMEESVAYLSLTLTHSLLHTGWSDEDAQTAHALFVQAATNPWFPLDEEQHLQLLKKATHEKRRAKGSLICAVDHVLSRDRSVLTGEEALACYEALEQLGVQKETDANTNRLIAVVELLLDNGFDCEARSLLERKSLRTHRSYSSCVERSLRLSLGPQCTSLDAAAYVCGEFYLKTGGLGLSVETSRVFLEELMLAYLKTGRAEELSFWRKKLEELTNPSSGWSQDFARRFVDVYNNLILPPPRPVRIFMGECLGIQSATLLQLPDSLELAQSVVAGFVHDRDSDVKALILLLMGAYKIGNEEAWDFLISIATPIEHSSFARDVFDAFVKIHVNGFLLPARSCWKPMFQIAAVRAKMPEQLELLTSDLLLKSARDSKGEIDYWREAAQMLDSCLEAVLKLPAAERPKFRARLEKAATVIREVCEGNISDDDTKRWSASIEKIPYPKSMRALSEEIDELMQRGKVPQAKVDRLIFGECATEEKRQEYDAIALPLISRLAAKGAGEVKTARVIAHLLSLQRQACNKAAAELLPAYAKKKLAVKAGSSQHTAMAKEADQAYVTLIGRCKDGRDTAVVRQSLKMAESAPLFVEGQVRKLQQELAVRAVEIDIERLGLMSASLTDDEKERAVDDILRRLKENEDQVRSLVELIKKLQKVCTTSLFDCYDNIPLHIKIVDFLIGSKSRRTAPIKDLTRSMMQAIVSSQNFNAPLKDPQRVLLLNKLTTALLAKVVEMKLHDDRVVSWIEPIISMRIPLDHIDEPTKLQWNKLLEIAKLNGCFYGKDDEKIFLDLIVNGSSAKVAYSEIGDLMNLLSRLSANLLLRGEAGQRYYKLIELRVLEAMAENQRHLNKINTVKFEMDELTHAFEKNPVDETVFDAFRGLLDCFKANWDYIDSNTKIIMPLVKLHTMAGTFGCGDRFNGVSNELYQFAKLQKTHSDSKKVRQSVRLAERIRKVGVLLGD